MSRLIVFSAEGDVTNEHELINELFRAGMQLFHLRKPAFDLKMQKEFLDKIEPAYYPRISVHQHQECIAEYDLKYFHVKEEKRNKKMVVPAGLISSTSFHRVNDLLTEGKNWDYCFLSPIFNSISKSGYNTTIPENFSPNEKHKVYALGGISAENLEIVLQRGFFGAAVLGFVWQFPEKALQQFYLLNQICKQNAHMY